MHKRIRLPLIVASMISACASGPPPIKAPKLLPPASLTELPAERLPLPQSPGLDDLLQNHIETARQYHRLRQQLRGLVEWMVSTETPSSD